MEVKDRIDFTGVGDGVILATRPEDEPSRVFLKRIEFSRATQPSPDRDDVFPLTVK